MRRRGQGARKEECHSSSLGRQPDHSHNHCRSRYPSHCGSLKAREATEVLALMFGRRRSRWQQQQLQQKEEEEEEEEEEESVSRAPLLPLRPCNPMPPPRGGRRSKVP